MLRSVILRRANQFLTNQFLTLTAPDNCIQYARFMGPPVCCHMVSLGVGETDFSGTNSSYEVVHDLLIRFPLQV